MDVYTILLLLLHLLHHFYPLLIVCLFDQWRHVSIAVFIYRAAHITGKQKCAEEVEQVLKVLTELLGHENHEVNHQLLNS